MLLLRGDMETPSPYSLTLNKESRNHLGVSGAQLVTIAAILQFWLGVLSIWSVVIWYHTKLVQMRLWDFLHKFQK